MLSFKIKSDESLTININDELNTGEFDRISLFIESIFDVNPYSEIFFNIDSNLNEGFVTRLREFCYKLRLGNLIIKRAIS